MTIDYFITTIVFLKL